MVFVDSAGRRDTIAMNSPESNNLPPDDVRHLSGLQQAFFIMSCLYRGINEEEIANRLDGDSEIVEIWIRFLCEMGWLVKKDSTSSSNNNRWILTDMGRIELAQKEVFGTA